MIIDGLDLKTIGLALNNRGASRSTPTFVEPFAEIPGARTSRRTGNGIVSAKPVTLQGYIKGSTPAELRSLIDQVVWYLRPETDHTLRWSDDSTREWVVRFREMIVRGRGREWIAVAGKVLVEVEITMMAEDPRARAPSETAINNPGALPRVLTPTGIGDAPMPVVLTITGNNGSPVTSLTVEYRDSADVVIYSFDWDGADLTGSDTLVIDTGLASVERNGVNDVDSISDPDGALAFDMDPEHGDFIAPAYPDIRISGTGTADVCRLTYRERWW